MLNYISDKCIGNGGVAVVIEAEHMCVKLRGIKHDSKMQTAKLSGAFSDVGKTRSEFYGFINSGGQ